MADTKMKSVTLLLSTIFICDLVSAKTQKTRYQVVFQNKNWTEAHSHCMTHFNSKLVMIENEEDQRRLRAFFETLNDTAFSGCYHVSLYGEYGHFLWTAGYVPQSSGLCKCDSISNLHVNGQNLWMQLYPMSFQLWNIDPPIPGEERCIIIWSMDGYRWIDSPCSEELCFICENRNV